jgi:hypothetical protein|tara:strand:+ start:559 stop:663 length:105 start_codon:yes stop_codon:yes gene_type:complete
MNPEDRALLERIVIAIETIAMNGKTPEMKLRLKR